MALRTNMSLPPSEKTPVGHIMASTNAIGTYGSLTPPPNYLFCDGASYSTSAYPALFAVIGYAFGGSGGSFNVPNLSGRSVVGSATGAAGAPGYVNGSDPNASTWNTHVQTLGNTDGATVHTLTTSEMPVHNHSATDSGHTHTAHYNGNGTSTVLNGYASGDGGGNNTMPPTNAGYANVTIGNAGSGAAHSITQPTTVLHMYIKYT